MPPARWLLGRIVEKHPGVDKVTRVVSLRFKNSIIKRPVSKLIVLPIWHPAKLTPASSPLRSALAQHVRQRAVA
ncbi:unnamed protein product [Parnassius mnemosyne]|uniref:DUF5641 domain-containing protein n=1 Tax=Parnassius mnemosyne TaxID=213953 RepID=A0AAV1KTB4_9NEOP